MGKSTKRTKKREKLRVPRSTRRPGVVLLGEVPSVPLVDIELLALKELLEQCHRLTRPARLYLAARLQEDVALF